MQNVFQKPEEVRVYFVSNCVICGNRKYRFVDVNQTVSGDFLVFGNKMRHAKSKSSFQ